MRPKTLILKVDPQNPSINVIREAARILAEGGLVAFPTETVYGLGAAADIREAVLKIFKVKNRPPDNPLILHLADPEWLPRVSRNIPSYAYKLIEKFWPGPLTLILPKAEQVLSEVTAGLPKVAVRVPAHRVAQLLIKELGKPVAAPSANRSGRPSPTHARHVIEDFNGQIDAIIDAGETLHGVESTILDITLWPPVLLRPGAIPIEEIEMTLGVKVTVPEFARGIRESEEAIAPGTKYRHYAPMAEMILVEAEDYKNLDKLVEKVKEIALKKISRGVKVGILCSDETAHRYEGLGLVVSLGPRSDSFIIARNLFKALRSMDELGVEFIVAEGFEEKGLGLTVMNRLRKASGHNVVNAV
ncbi:translation factor Sua5 [Infirmifilum uzonense]|uniref:Threonylcarbamoyl-AMP synthase n=1 Tax=Infirmifilum uzonense TaxID=1550241 RepID=A0A0F7FHN7_9CREN|nr:L-threonylcarbamoyladenylate synthase [Infirmifilum uzonense]AKG38232.1 translation factor Sua5 [Infirmifilum uzonense]